MKNENLKKSVLPWTAIARSRTTSWSLGTHHAGIYRKTYVKKHQRRTTMQYVTDNRRTVFETFICRSSSFASDRTSANNCNRVINRFYTTNNQRYLDKQQTTKNNETTDRESDGEPVEHWDATQHRIDWIVQYRRLLLLWSARRRRRRCRRCSSRARCRCIVGARFRCVCFVARLCHHWQCLLRNRKTTRQLCHEILLFK